MGSRVERAFLGPKEAVPLGAFLGLKLPDARDLDDRAGFCEPGNGLRNLGAQLRGAAEILDEEIGDDLRRRANPMGIDIALDEAEHVDQHQDARMELFGRAALLQPDDPGPRLLR